MAKYTTEEKIKLLQQKIKSLQTTEKAAKRKERARQLIQIGALVSSHHSEPEKLLESLKNGHLNITIEETQQIRLYFAYANQPEKVFQKVTTFQAGLSISQILESLKSQAPQKIHIYRIEKIAFRIEDPENAGFKLKS